MDAKTQARPVKPKTGIPAIKPTVPSIPKSPVAPSPPDNLTPKPPEQTQVVPSTASPSTIDQKENLKRTLIDLKIKKANLSKMSLDWDMQELMGEISAEELEQKKQKMVVLEKKIDQQIIDLQAQLDSL